jgi:phage baseplate assembly protein W
MEIQANLGRDIELELLDNRLLRVYQAAATATRSVEGGRGLTIRDFKTLQGRDNLGQALLMRLLTPQGELSPLGHPSYGSRLHEIIGARNTETIRNLAKLHVLASLDAERRIDKVNAVEVTPHPSLRDTIRIAIEVLPIGADVPLAISFTLELGTGGQG